MVPVQQGPKNRSISKRLSTYSKRLSTYKTKRTPSCNPDFERESAHFSRVISRQTFAFCGQVEPACRASMYKH